ncbi:MAG: hypothetical protein Q8R92_13820, partial [Deltaproteobacteria bacterium]|nr:hypothetical protein [Deltaproteobacteria bacterium]
MPNVLTTDILPGAAQWRNSSEIPGAFNVVATIADRDAIVAADRVDNMWVYVIADDTTYQLGGGLTNADWLVQTTAGGARRLVNKTNLGTAVVDPKLGLVTMLYVDPVVGSDTAGDGTLVLPYETFLRALEDVGTTNEESVVIRLLQGSVPIPPLLSALNNVTIAGPTPSVVASLTIATVTAASDP